ncbi:MAG: DUF4139 domain-containing protein [Candidatus Omnitrophica bacterium]|nr:DUF4139 domain-containing protein [Candidatus Omnitrophota bacterium]
MKILILFFLFLSLAMPGTILAEENIIQTPIQSVALFKNGLAVVTRTIPVQSAGRYSVELDIAPVQGTFWINQSNITTRVLKKEVTSNKIPDDISIFNKNLVGKEVEIFFNDNNILPVKGTIQKIESSADTRTWSRQHENTRYPHSTFQNVSRIPGFKQSSFWYVKTLSGLTLVDPGIIAYFNVLQPIDSYQHTQSVLQLQVDKLPEDTAPLTMRYLTKGLSWTPSYRLDMTDPAQLTIEQKIVIKNELEDLANVPIELISGYPEIKFAHVISPLSLQTTWQKFFNQLNQRPRQQHNTTINTIATQSIQHEPDYLSPNQNNPTKPMGDGVDLHYHSIGKHSLRAGEVLSLKIARSQTPYEKIIEWIIPDTRDAEGRYVDDYRRRENPNRYKETAWDAIRFENPFDFPMTTAATMIESKGHFNGQTISYWVNAGERTTLHITKALSIRTRSTEKEKEGTREIINYGGNRYRKVQIEGFLFVVNHREEPVPLTIRRQFSGELVQASDNPQTQLREEGAYSVNARNELFWEISLAAGEQKQLHYEYTVLVRH